jgi:hypothetical protein
LRAKGWPSDDEFRAKFVRFNLYQSKYDRAVLDALELASQAKSEPVLLDGCSIEHVMPQTIDDAEDDGRAWVAALGADWRPLHAEWLHTPGNLTLVGADYNSEMAKVGPISRSCSAFSPAAWWAERAVDPRTPLRFLLEVCARRPPFGRAAQDGHGHARRSRPTCRPAHARARHRSMRRQ